MVISTKKVRFRIHVAVRIAVAVELAQLQGSTGRGGRRERQDDGKEENLHGDGGGCCGSVGALLLLVEKARKGRRGVSLVFSNLLVLCSQLVVCTK